MYHSPSTQTPSSSYHPAPQSRYYENSTPTQPSSSYIPRTPGMDPAVYTGVSRSPPLPFSPHTSHPASTATSTPYQHGSTSAPRTQYLSTDYSHQFVTSISNSPSVETTALTVSEDQHITVQECSPYEGGQGTPLTIKCDVNFPPSPPASTSGHSPGGRIQSQGRALRVVFGSHPVQTQVMVLGNGPGGGQLCQLNATVPSWSSTGAQSLGRGNRIPIYVQVLDGSHAIVETVHAGEFTYSSMGPKVYPSYTPPTNSLKRAGEALESHRPSPNQYLHRRVLSNSKFEPPLENSQYPALQHPYSPNPEANQYSSPHLSHTPSLSSQPSLNSYSPSPVQPNLMRATQIQQSAVPVPVANPYPISGSTKARLELQGDLDAMSKGWSQEEWMNRRRLVQFWRRQEGTSIFAAFRPLPQQDYPQAQQSIIISCIFREDVNECFVTSVDAIYLLEALVGTRFTVEEKNRIRRNLEGFHPQTVSKNKGGCDDFFKLIMGFPNPKPRNIEKDVKVFAWNDLASALKKIIGKYSASYPMSGGSLPLQISTPQATPQPYSAPTMPAPLPIQDYSNTSVVSSGSAPTLVSHSSSDSSNYNGDSYRGVPETPTGSIPPSDSPVQYRSHSNPTQVTSGEKYSTGESEYVGFANESPHTTQASHGYWADNVSTGYAIPASGLYDQPHHLPHVHESQSRHPSSNDLRVVYPA